MSDEPKIIVEQAYDHIADWYLNWVKDQDSPRERYTDKVLKNAPAAPRILELGCGPGIPITRMLLDRGAQVTANDISTKFINMAKERCPEATFLPGDMMALDFEPASFHGITSFFTIFHLPREEQKTMLSKINSWLKPGGMFVMNLATMDEEEIHGEMMGYGMFWSSFDVEDNKKMVTDSGLDLVETELLEAGDGKLEEDDPDYGVKFLWLVAKKKLDL
ncbi:methyltransferase type 11 [Microthyrium microscopicum]|uniref:Methyltransferase type 11 n=1 Tax=Microthyrium microscopicum TaxID=703497 RepID=A0A6A6TZR8_9PEZI|nr:methyltransferase type 11 [Microthyrium microscopicum]